MDLQRAAAILGMDVGIAALLLQISVSIPAYLAAGLSLPLALVSFFSYFTILTNLCLVLVYVSELSGTPWLGWFRSQTVRTMMAGVALLVMAFYHLLLSGLWAPEGLQRMADIGLHYVTPVLYVLWWWIFSNHGGVRWRDIPLMLLPSLLYVIYILIRGTLVASYPYPILEADRLGYPQVFFNIVIVAVALVVLFVLFIAADRRLASPQAEDSAP